MTNAGDEIGIKDCPPTDHPPAGKPHRTRDEAIQDAYCVLRAVTRDAHNRWPFEEIERFVREVADQLEALMHQHAIDVPDTGDYHA